MFSEAHWCLVPRPFEKGPLRPTLRRLTATRGQLVWVDSRQVTGPPPPLFNKLDKEHILWRALNKDHPLGWFSQLPRLDRETGAPMKSCLYHKLTGARPFPSPGLSFLMSAVSKSALKLAVLMESSLFLNSIDTFICVLWDQPAHLAEMRLCGEELGRRETGDIFGGQRRKSGEAF